MYYIEVLLIDRVIGVLFLMENFLFELFFDRFECFEFGLMLVFDLIEMLFGLRVDLIITVGNIIRVGDYTLLQSGIN